MRRPTSFSSMNPTGRRFRPETPRPTPPAITASLLLAIEPDWICGVFANNGRVHGDEDSHCDPSVFNFPRLPRGPVVGCGVRKHLTDVAGPGADAVTKPDADANASTDASARSGPGAGTSTCAGPSTVGRADHDRAEPGPGIGPRHPRLRFGYAVPLAMGPDPGEHGFECRLVHPAHQFL